jgi:hypothetical protein
MPAPNLITREDVAAMLGNNFNADMVRKNEKRLGIDKARKDINARVIRYRHDIVVQILTSRGLLAATASNFRK